ncbi:hypothetical protein DYB32_007729 [Aphanomyces invadans]|uniref:EF-hand domain-containing protein n=1 Tax=Aphanomyces invadans TaxID=157072 RepID=A0A418ANB2_9STRA|nr:hypothetical protein DYB32_007729 [Aphanomyces invadans]
MPLEELYACLRAIFPHVNTTPIALKNESNTLFPLSLLSRHPSTFSRAKKDSAALYVPFELVCLGDPDVSYTELTRPARVGWHHHAQGTNEELTQFTLPQLIHEFRRAAPTGTKLSFFRSSFMWIDEKVLAGALDRSSFQKALPLLVPTSSPDATTVHLLLSRLFDVFDKDRTGVVDVIEFVSGLSVLVQGDRDEKIQAMFSLYDSSAQGFISRDDMTTYLTSVYLTIAELNPEVFATNHVDPIQLGHVTAAQCFEDADLNHDGRLSYAEFQVWYSKSVHHHQPHARKLKQVHVKQVDSQLRQPIQVKWTLSAVRDMTGLGDYAVDEMLGWFPHDNALTEADFLATMKRILQRQRKPVTQSTIALLHTLFNLFDSDHNGVLNALELKTGLSVLCHPDPYGGSVRAAFDLMDSNGDGRITLEEMTLYLRSVFRVLHGVTNAHVPVPPDVLATLTAQEMFQRADLNHDGKISFDEFHAWFTAAPTTALPTPPPLFPSQVHGQHHHLQTGTIPGGVALTPPTSVTLERVGALTNLSWRHPLDVFEVVALYVNADGVLTKHAFDQAFLHLMQGSTTSAAQARMVVDRLFLAFDGDGDGVVDYCELSSGLSLLCAGSQQEKIEAAFTLYDVNKDQFISKSELVSYLTAVFRVIYAFGPPPIPGVSPVELAESTAADAFSQYDSNHDGQLSLDEFTAWYSAPTPSAPPVPQHPPASGHAKPSHASSRGPHTAPSSYDLEFLRRARQVTHLGQYAVADIFSFFQASATNDQLSKAQFFRCFNKLLSKSSSNGASQVTVSPQLLKATLEQLFVLFDTDGNGVVDTKELAAGLSLLCGGSHQDKVQAAFSLYDKNGDGFISREEMTEYLTAVFKVLLQTSPALHAQLGHVSADHLAQATTGQAFATCDLNHDNKLSIDEFTAWYQAPQPGAVRNQRRLPAAAPRTTSSSPLSPAHARALLGLGHLTADTLVDLFHDRLTAHVVSEKAFVACFSKLMQSENDSEKAVVHGLVNELYQSFHKAFRSLTPGLCYQDVACGLSVLAQDESADAKVRATFRLMDQNGDMALSKDELVRYFTAVFAVMYVLNPPADAAHVSAHELAAITADHTMEQADTNADNSISFAEFQRWYTQGVRTEGPAPLPSLREIRHITALGYLEVDEAFERLADCADDDMASSEGGSVSLEAFVVCLTNLAHEFHGHVPLALPSVATGLYRAFVKDATGDRVEFAELAAGLSVLCKGSRDAKVQAAFSLYDYNSDGYGT